MFPGQKETQRATHLSRVAAVSLWSLGLSLPQVLNAAEPSFENDIAPLLTAHCIECHNPDDRKGGLDLTHQAGFIQGGESGPIVDPNAPLQSHLLQRVIQGEMPPEDRGRSRALTTEDIQKLQAWIQAGTDWTKGRTLSLLDQTTATRAGRDWWSLQPITRPVIANTDQRSAIDILIQEKRREERLQPAPKATKRQLIRRASYDLLGLPPTLEEVRAFVADTDPSAYEQLLDRLLSSPHYGERWGRFWLDVVRFAETDGYERDRIKPHVWRYRDWVIDALNADQPYNEFVTHQLAGDEIPQATEQSTIATGMLRVGTWNDEPNDPADYVYERLEDMVHTTSSAFLGLTIKCARCHNHKFDPILQTDYYRVASYFWSGYIGQGNQGGPNAEQLGFENVYGWTDRAANVDAIRLLIKGNRHQPGQAINPKSPAILKSIERAFTPPPTGTKTTQRRLQFAQWITDPNNPLTPRVIVNRLWQHHFGHGIIRTPNNLGFKSDPPTYPKLLDWLAAELVSPTVSAGKPWSLKRIHQLIMLSETYQQSSIHPKFNDLSLQDYENRYLWRYPRRRLDAEALRDSILTVSGQINPAMHGPSFYPRMSREAMEGLSRKEAAWKESSPDERARRSVYMMTQRSRLLPLMTSFDFTETTSTCAQRDVTTVAPQALALLNNEFIHRQSQAFAKSVHENHKGAMVDQINRIWERAFQRSPSTREREQALNHISAQTQHFAEANHDNPALLALASLCQVVFNTNEFIYID